MERQTPPIPSVGFRMEMQTFPIPSENLKDHQTISFAHPGYKDTSAEFNIFLRLPSADQIGDVSGVHHGTALTACQIIANNAFDKGFLASDPAGNNRVHIPIDGLLTEKLYYFVIPNLTGMYIILDSYIIIITNNSFSILEPYPVVPSFRDWEFPHDKLPDSWPVVRQPLFNGYRCSVSNFTQLLESAHLIPGEEADWFIKNDMEKYCSEFLLKVDTPNNLIQMKVDIHRLFDARGLVIVPKKITADGVPQYVTHMINNRDAEFWPTYHNVALQYLPRNSQAFLFARFAWAILLSVKSFITRKGRRYVIRRITTTTKDGCPQQKYISQFLTHETLISEYGGGGTKNATPKKRGAASMDDDLMELSSSENDENRDEVFDQLDNPFMKAVGRRKKQRSSESTAPSLPEDVESEIKETVFQGLSELYATTPMQED